MVDGIVKKILESDVRVAAKLNRDIDDGAPSTREILEPLYRHTGKAYGIGTTGAPGVGKSTLVDQMIRDVESEWDNGGRARRGSDQHFQRRGCTGGPYPHAPP